MLGPQLHDEAKKITAISTVLTVLYILSFIAAIKLFIQSQFLEFYMSD
jgi:hypothetical protein